MQELRLVKFPDPVLRKKAAIVDKVTSRERSILEEMANIMYLSQGVGLAANQVGIGMQLVVIDVGEGLLKMINPAISRKQGSESQEEGCLSCPGLSVKIKRAGRITVSYLDEEGNEAEIGASGLLARAVQHELDHLSGRLIIDYLGPLKKLMAGKKLAGTKSVTRKVL